MVETTETMSVEEAVARLAAMERWHARKANPGLVVPLNAQPHDIDARAIRVVLEALEEAKRDSARLDWLDARREAIEDFRTVGRQVGDDEWEPELECVLLGYHWEGINGQCDSIRDAIDAEARP